MGRREEQGSTQANSILVFVDGYCPLCHWLARWIRKRDKNNMFQFHSLSSELARKMLPAGLYANTNTVVVLHKGRIYTKGRAVVYILRHLSGWKIIAIILGIFPNFLLDAGYTLIAKLRYKLFGKYDVRWLDNDKEF